MNQPITLAIAGEVMLGRMVNKAIAVKGPAYPWGNVTALLKEADLFLVNLECVLAQETEQRLREAENHRYYFRADPSAVAALKTGRVDFVCLANNHSLTCGPEGLAETIQALDGAGIAHAGAGENLDAARAPARLNVKGVRVSVVAFANRPAAWAATPNSPGINYTPVSLEPADFTKIESALAAAREQADLVIFTIHWHPDTPSQRTPISQEFARRVIDAGADIFWGHGSHLVQGIELYQEKPILYDTGDFLDDYALDPVERRDLSALFLLQVLPTTVQSFGLVPVHIGDLQVNVAQGGDQEWFLWKIASLCQEMGTLVNPG